MIEQDNKIDDQLFEACMYGNFEKILLKAHDHDQLEQCFVITVKYGQNNIFEQILSIPNFTKNLSPATLIKSLNWAVLNKNYDALKLLSSSPELKEYVHLDSCLNKVLSSVAVNGFFEIAKFLLISTNVDIHADNDTVLKCAAGMGNLEMVEFLLSSPILKVHADIDVLSRSKCSSNQVWEWVENYKTIKKENETLLEMHNKTISKIKLL